ncbi:hypothetical protein [Paraurantiacibacter namhicola]|uniref:Uncharacterized protein n=1 Tax=Paraurantiacibacter namhicola TaxID=645517 RepID=A0A1C7D4P7_9SPHN|nr:hypothetical protein [Paraurantiacibacter namhicola]ANU06437.1 hypothetical protein A6F65_00109 [Paraurantiacibacter namhicola]
MAGHDVMSGSQPATRTDDGLKLRPAAVVMDLERLGTLHPYRLSFMRSLIRKIGRENWQIKRANHALDDRGHGHVVYEIRTANQLFSFVAFAKHLEPESRSDRVIAEDWDMTATLCEGTVDTERLERLRSNVPLQEKGRVDASCLVLSRANKSVRNFDYVVDCLCEGHQPSVDVLAKVGYLYRTTAVYGSGKFGLADWRKVSSEYPDFSRPFMAEMLVCYLIRQFSLDQVEHIAHHRSGGSHVPLDAALKRYIGIGNATGLGMAPYLINHPLLINRWIEARETALARVLREGAFDTARFERFCAIARQAIRHLEEIATDNQDQNAINDRTRQELSALLARLESGDTPSSWQDIMDLAEDTVGTEARELTCSIMMELHPELIDDLEDGLCEDEEYRLDPDMSLDELRSVIEDRYDWALAYDFDDEAARATFWYRSEEKMEPRLGVRGQEPGEDREMMLGIGYAVQQCYEALTEFAVSEGDATVADFAMAHPEHRRVLRRIQTMARTHYGEIRANLLDAAVLPIHLLRCKLSFFGVGKFDPRSRLWVRNTMFQGAPLPEELGEPGCDEWYFPVKPQAA